ncbi:MAG: hypothetical protein ACO1SV_06910 [Fimbriimonas sp.]
MSHDITPVTTRVPTEFEAEYREMPIFLRDDLKKATFALVEKGSEPEAVVAKLQEAGYSRPLAVWYEAEVRAAQRPVDLYVSTLGNWGKSDIESPDSDRPETALYRQQAKKFGNIAGTLHLLGVVCWGVSTQAPALALALIPISFGLFVALKVYQYKTAVALCGLKEEPPGCFSALTLVFGWWVIFFLFHKPTPKYGDSAN